MVKLARISEYQSPDNQRTVVRQDRRDASAESALYGQVAQTGAAMAEAGDRMRRAQIEADLAHAQMTAADRLDKAYLDLQRNTEIEPEEVESAYRTKAEEILKEEGARINAPMFQRAWQQQAAAMATDGVSRARRLGMERQADRVRANVLNVGAEYKRLAEDPSTSAETLALSEQTYRQLIERQKRAGIFDEEAASALLIEAEETSRTGRSMRHLAEIDALTDSNRYAAAKEYLRSNWTEINPRQREAIEDVLDGKEQEQEAVRTADQFWRESDGDFQSALASARAISDVDQRKAVEDQLNTLRLQDNAAEAARKNEAADEGWGLIEQGVSTSNIPAPLWRSIDGKTRLAMKDYERNKWRQAVSDAKAREADFETDRQEYVTVRELIETDPRAARDHLFANSSKFDDTDFERLLEKTTEALNEEPDAIKSVRSTGQAAGDALRSAGLDNDTEVRGELLVQYDAWQEDFQRREGREPTDQERDERLSNLSARIRLRKPGLLNDTKASVFELEQVGTIPERHTQAVLEAFDFRGDGRTDVDESTLEAAYAQGMAYLRINGVADPSPALLTRVVRERPWETGAR